ncbi:FAD-dependent oxidoreductase [Chryseobacterium balustinum]|uniref:Flavin-dependent monooxygenase n=1 Tax=Chryseobacterium balustinum TaxID=246 RepID=A0AAX2IQX5_9FLAO|nr:NAD(P)/FAD-dependent oxidoreductase [Chryseobacterium balustinum]AZB29458.1 FAD-dependent monooxygenase [Chryseobacterium balustinum]SKB74948.1 2-polyprenyl-6-methoxyphenol hydroxylase [Chryseobacterium balustinum]SQA92125.1 6-hydroxynicotinate 3-monooxygenase precursor [Chryseobacterium balustinum]
MLLQNKQIAIIGGGPGGLTLAKLLQLKDVDIKVYERDLNKNVRVQGSPLDLHDESGLAALRKAGLLDDFKNNFMVGADQSTITNHKAEIFFSDHGQKQDENFGDEHFRPEIDRGVLRKILLESLDPETIIWDSHFLSMAKQDEGWLLHFKNKESVYADIVIGADGANSKIRPFITDIKAFYSGITMLEGNVYEAEKKVPNISKILRGGKIMAFGNEQDILMGQKANGEIGFYASFKADENWEVASGLDFSDQSEVLKWFQKEYPEWSSVWDELFENSSTPFIPRPIYCMPLDQTWNTVKNLTIIGDAAHLMPPFAGEGVNMAMLDALELSEVLTSSQFNSIESAIAEYEMNMFKRASKIAQESLENGERMHSENALATMLDFFAGHKGL